MVKTKTVPTKAAKKTSTTDRKRKVGKYKSFRLQRKIPHPAGPIPGSWHIFKKARQLIWQNKSTLLVLLIIYLALNLVFVRGFASPLNVAEVRETITTSLGKDVSKTATTATIFTQLLGTSGATTEAASIYQALMLILFSLALIWVFRQSALGKKPSAKQALYNGMYPLVQFLLVLIVLFLQTLPAIFGSDMYSATVTSGIAANGYEKAVWTLLAASLILLTCYMLFSSLFALVIVTLPEMTPLKALRSSRQLVFSRRLSIFRKLLFVPLISLLTLIIIVVPAIYFIAPLAPWLYFALTVVAFVFVNAYMFCLYKEML